jgi:hypothetical protein
MAARGGRSAIGWGAVSEPYSEESCVDLERESDAMMVGSDADG